jgi:hypothetical protein
MEPLSIDRTKPLMIACDPGFVRRHPTEEP